VIAAALCVLPQGKTAAAKGCAARAPPDCANRPLSSSARAIAVLHRLPFYCTKDTAFRAHRIRMRAPLAMVFRMALANPTAVLAVHAFHRLKVLARATAKRMSECSFC
jgi:hypothetical protein